MRPSYVKRREAENLRGQFTTCKAGLDLAVRCPTWRCANRSIEARPISRRHCANCSARCEIGRLTMPEVTAQGLQMFAALREEGDKTESPAKAALRDKIFAEQFETEVAKIPGRHPSPGHDRIQMSAPGTLPLALTIGEPAGIGPDLALMVWRQRRELACRPSISSAMRIFCAVARMPSASMCRSVSCAGASLRRLHARPAGRKP